MISKLKYFKIFQLSNSQNNPLNGIKIQELLLFSVFLFNYYMQILDYFYKNIKKIYSNSLNYSYTIIIKKYHKLFK